MGVVPRPHVSEAIRQLRQWVSVAAGVVALCCAAQMFVFAFAAYTNVRWDEVKGTGPKSLDVIGADPSSASMPAKPVSMDPTAKVDPAPGAHAADQVVGGVRGTSAISAISTTAKGVELNRVRSPADLWMKRGSGLAAGAGVVGAVCLAVLAFLGVAVAGGGCVPGVERATTSAVWSIVLAIVCLPLERMLPGFGVPGVFASYADMTAAIDARMIGGTGAGSLALLGQWVAAPGVAMFAALGVALWFRAGVEAGIIVIAPSELERAVVREAEMIQKRGVASSAPKAVGALNQAMGGMGMSAAAAADGPRGAPAGTLSAVERALEASGMSGASASGGGKIARGLVSGGGVADGDFKRPI
jgi:hypothetical protein